MGVDKREEYGRGRDLHKLGSSGGSQPGVQGTSRCKQGKKQKCLQRHWVWLEKHGWWRNQRQPRWERTLWLESGWRQTPSLTDVLTLSSTAPLSGSHVKTDQWL